MKKVTVFALCVLLLCGCKNTNVSLDQMLSLRQKLLQSKDSSFQCVVTADYGEQVYQFTMLCNFEQNGNMNFSVVEPESISGITGTVGSGGGNLTFDDQILSFPLLADGYISPVSAPWLFMKTLRSGRIESCGKIDGGAIVRAFDSYSAQTMQVDITLDERDTPLFAEFIWEGRRILSMSVSEFSYL